VSRTAKLQNPARRSFRHYIVNGLHEVRLTKRLGEAPQQGIGLLRQLGVARGQNRRQIWPPDLNLPDELYSCHLRHGLIGNDQLNRGLPSKYGERLSCGIRLEHPVPEIFEHQGSLRIRVGAMENVQTLFAVSEVGHPLGVAVFVHWPHERFIVLHLVVEPRLRSSFDINAPVLLGLMREIRSTARRMPGVDRVELVYNACRAGRSSSEVSESR